MEELSELRRSAEEAEAQLAAELAAIDAKYPARTSEIAAVEAKFAKRLKTDGKPTSEIAAEMKANAIAFATAREELVFGETSKSLDVAGLKLTRKKSPGALSYEGGRAAVAATIAKRIGINTETMLRGELDSVPVRDLLSISVDVNASNLLNIARAGAVNLKTFGISLETPTLIDLK